MNHRGRIQTIIAGEPADRCGFWLGNPHKETRPRLHAYFQAGSDEELRQTLDDDMRWICPQFYADAYQDPRGLALFDTGLDREKHTRPPLADCTDVARLRDFPWPDPKYLCFDACLRDLENVGDVYRMSGFWTCFYHNIMDLLGMEEYLVKMHTHPKIVEAVTDRGCQFYYEANERFISAARGLVDGFFFGNDFGTQLSLICGPENFRRYIFPWFRQFTAQGHRHGLQVILHSCGSVFGVIEDLIEAGVQCLHPLQAKAAQMDAVTLARHFKGRLTFLGGVDTQQLLTDGTPEQVRRDVQRIKQILGPNLIVSPSHETILPNVPPENVAAMAAEAALLDTAPGHRPNVSSEVSPRRTIKTVATAVSGPSKRSRRFTGLSKFEFAKN